MKVKPPTREPDAGELLVRFGGRGAGVTTRPPYPYRRASCRWKANLMRVEFQNSFSSAGISKKAIHARGSAQDCSV